MAIKEVTMYTVICDGCGDDAFEDGEFSAYSDPGHALDIAVDSDWVRYDDKVYCDNCGMPACTCRHLYGDHDYEAGAPCQDCDCAGFVAAAREVHVG